MTTAVVKVEPRSAASDLMPVLSIEEAISRRNTIIDYGRRVMVEGQDFGKIPGTEKDTLLKPGAEKLCTLFALAPRFEIIQRTEDWTGKDHSGEPFFYYLIKCQLYRGERVVAEADGSCNSWESRYRYRNAERRCPSCGQNAIIRGKEEYGGGYVCFKKKGGCGAKFQIGDQSIESQPAGKVKNPDVADIVNTLIKMAEKRALVAAALIATSASEFYTQDAEDSSHVQDAEYEVRQPEPPPQQSAPPKPNGNGKKPPPQTARELEDAALETEVKLVNKKLCRPQEFVDALKKFAGGLPIRQWAPDYIADGCAELRRLYTEEFTKPAGADLLERIDALGGELFGGEDGLIAYVQEHHQMGKEQQPSVFQAKKIIADLDRLAKQKKQNAVPAGAQSDSPF